jgi:hypothetical protein
MSLVLNVEILGEFKKLTQATQGAQGDLTGMGKQASKISKGIAKAFAAIGIGLSFKVIANELKEATKAAIEDRKSQELLAIAMINTGKATDEHVKAAETSIAKMQIQAGIADDKLRPAYQKLFIATGDVTKSNKLMEIALDASAATGKDLDTVTQAMAKSLAGNDAALAKLIPSLRDSKNPIEEMGKAFKGASTEAANLDPYQRMQIIFGEIQEKLGTALLPILDDFAEWMMSPPGQKQLQEIADSAYQLLTELAKVAKWAFANKDWLAPLVIGVTAIAGAAKVVTGIKTAIDGANAAMLIFNGTTLANPLIRAGATAALILALGGDAPKTSTRPPEIRDEQGRVIPLVPNSPLTTPQPGRPNTGFNFGGSTVNNNIVINTPKVNASDIVNTINNATRTGFTGSIRVAERQ